MQNNDSTCCTPKNWRGGSGGDAVYGIGLIGAAVYFITQANTFWEGLLGLVKAFVWPAILVYELLKSLIG